MDFRCQLIILLGIVLVLITIYINHPPLAIKGTEAFYFEWPKKPWMDGYGYTNYGDVNNIKNKICKSSGTKQCKYNTDCDKAEICVRVDEYNPIGYCQCSIANDCLYSAVC